VIRILSNPFKVRSAVFSRHSWQWLSWVLAVTLAMTGHAQETPQQAQQKLQQARDELRDTRRERQRLDQAHNQASQRLRELDEHVARSGQILVETETALQHQQQQLAELHEQRALLETDLEAQRQQLAQLLRNSYQLSQHTPLKLVLSPDSVIQGRRQRTYYRYLHQHYAQAMAALAVDLQVLSDNEQHIAQAQAALEEIRQTQQAQADTLAADRQQRADALAELEKQQQSRQQREQHLQANVQELERVVSRLQAAARRNAEAAAAARRRANASASTTTNNATTTRPTTPSTPATPAAAAPRVGGLGWPLSGQLLARYGARLPDGRSSKGLLIGATAGSPIHAVADGRVVYADWMNGYGMILIIDHGNNYLSLYAHNDSLLHRNGERVRRGQAVATVGNSGGQGVSALYFELRRNGEAVDPVPWLQRQ